MPDKLTLDINMAKKTAFCLCWNQSYGSKSDWFYRKCFEPDSV